MRSTPILINSEARLGQEITIRSVHHYQTNISALFTLTSQLVRKPQTSETSSILPYPIHKTSTDYQLVNITFTLPCTPISPETYKFCYNFTDPTLCLIPDTLHFMQGQSPSKWAHVSATPAIRATILAHLAP